MTYPSRIENLPPDTANNWLELAMTNILQEYPHVAIIYTTSPQDVRPHRQHHPAFFGSLDWHSCVEMYWVATRLMRLCPGMPGESRAVAIIDELLTPENIETEHVFCEANPSFERPYGWGWLLKLQHELDIWDSNQAARWRDILRPLSDQLRSQFAAWLPKLTYPQRIGMHTNTAFALWLSLPHISMHDEPLHELIRERASTWFGNDTGYPFAYEPSGADFLSAGLCEAVLMRHLMSQQAFESWIHAFLPASVEPWLTPATVSDVSDGQIAHLHGLNLSRAWALGELASAIPARAGELTDMRAAHIAASMDAVSGSHYMVEHWLVAYALLLLTEP